jgi:hypothetical protein
MERERGERERERIMRLNEWERLCRLSVRPN